MDAAKGGFPQLVFGEGSVNGPWLEYGQHGGRVSVAPREAAFRAVACEEVHRRTAGDTPRARGAFSTRALASRTSQRSGPVHFAGHPWQRGGASPFAVDPDYRSFSDLVPDRPPCADGGDQALRLASGPGPTRALKETRPPTWGGPVDGVDNLVRQFHRPRW